MGYRRITLITNIEISKRAIKSLEKLPEFIAHKLTAWIKTVRRIGIENTRRISGYHDEPLNGKRFGQRSIRLNRSYRAIYIVKKEEIEFVEILEVNKHDY